MNTIHTGTLLVAEPFLKDSSFMRTVVLVCRYSVEDGAFGFVINKPTSFTLDELIPEMKGHPLEIFEGGPVQLNTLHFIHQFPELIPDSQKIAEKIYWGGDFEVLKTLIRNGEINVGQVKFFMGYSGWDENQLEEEIEEKSWLLTTVNSRLIFQTPAEKIWRNSVLQTGPENSMMIHYPTDPQLN